MKLWVLGALLLAASCNHISLPLLQPGSSDLLDHPPGLSVPEFTAQLGNYENVIFTQTFYTVSLSVGTPAQNFSLLLDTGSGYLWVASPTCADCSHNRTFNASASSTYYSDESLINITYVNGFASGFSSSDAVALSDLSVSGQPFVLVTDEFFYEELRADGVLGMGFSNLASGMSTLMDTLMSQGEIDQRVFSVYLTRSNDTRDSELMIGGFNTSRYAYGNQIYYFPLIGSSLGQWTVELFSIRFDSKKMSVSQTVALVDTGAGLITAPLSDFLTLVEWFKEYANCDTDGRYLWCDCHPKLTNSGFPELGFDLGTATLFISSENYLLPYTTARQTYCVVLVQARDINLWVIGAVFLRQFYSIYDMEELRVGFASVLPKPEPNTTAVWTTAIVIVVAVCIVAFAVLFCICSARWKVAHRQDYGRVRDEN